MAKTPFIIVPEMTAIAVAYRNGRFIADQVLPYVPVGTKEFRYRKFGLGDSFTVPPTLVGRRGSPQQVEWGETEVTDSVQDHALDAPVPNDDIAQYERARAAGQTNATDPMLRATNQVTELLMLAREKRAADLVFNLNTYAAANRVTLAPGSRFSDDAVKPHNVITDALDGMVMRPNIAVFGRVAWSKTQRNPNLVKAVYGQGTEQGSVTRQQFADLFELDEVIVGEGFINTAPKGQAATLTRLWGRDVAFLHRNMNADTDFGITFGFTARFGDRVGGYVEDADMGMRGGRRARSGESVKELVTANDLGYLFKDAVSA
jgi:hypothetical protein